MRLSFFLFAFTIFLIPALCLADNPRVTSVAANPPEIGSGYMTALSWTIEGPSAGPNLYFFCPQGVKITNPNGATIPCNTRYTASSNASGFIGLKLTNISGQAASLLVRVYPKNESGNDYDPGAMDTYITVNAVPHLLTEFTATTTVTAATLKATTTATFTWIGSYLDGINFQFTCADGVNIFQSGNLSPLPCNRLALTNNLPGSGSVVFIFTNSSFSEASVNALILPMISTDAYDALQGISLPLDIPGRTLQKSILVNYFTAPKLKITSGDSLDFSWNATNASGINLQLACNNTIAVRTSQSTTTSEILRCGTPTFDQILPAVSNTTLYFTNNSVSEQTLSIFLLPQNDDGTYNGMIGKKLDIVIMPPGSAAPPASVTAALPTSEPASANTGIKVVHTVTFTQYFYKTSRASQVKALQQFLAQDKTLYPEGLITGYFGALTELAVQRFQERYGIAKNGDEGYGIVGPKTRAKLNSLDIF